jgi:hypothetical protein
LLLTAGVTQAAVTYDWEMNPGFAEYHAAQPSSTDVLQGNLGTVKAGGFHWVTPAPGEQWLTDGAIDSECIRSILQDFAAANCSLWIIYDFEPTVLTEINTFGASGDADGRVFQNVSVGYKDQFGMWHSLIDYAHTGPYYRSNVDSHSSLIHIYDTEGGPILDGGGTPIVFHGLAFKFWLVDNTMNWFMDPFDPGLNTASKIKEIDAIPEPTTIALLGLGGLALLRRKR